MIGSLVFQVDMGKRTPSFCKCWSAWKDTLTSLQSKPSKNLIQILNAALGGAEKLERKMLRRQNGAVPDWWQNVQVTTVFKKGDVAKHEKRELRAKKHAF